MSISGFGGTDVFEPVEMDKPVAGAGQLLIRVMASGTNPVDAKLRASGTWAHIHPPAVLGYEASGEVEETGEGVTGFRKGDQVYYTSGIFGNQLGTYAEYNVVPADIVALKPASLDHVEAAAVPLAGGTAWEALIDRLIVQPGETILIHGGAGGVGSFAVQIAKMAGARVIATAGPDHQETLKELGADVALNYQDEDIAQRAMDETGGEGVDVVFDTAGHDNIIKSLPVTKSFGRLATILGVNGNLSSISRQNQTLYGVFLTRDARRLKKMAQVIDQGRMKPLVDEVLPLSQVAKAHHRLDTGHGRGKMVLDIGL